MVLGRLHRYWRALARQSGLIRRLWGSARLRTPSSSSPRGSVRGIALRPPRPPGHPSTITSSRTPPGRLASRPCGPKESAGWPPSPHPVGYSRAVVTDFAGPQQVLFESRGTVALPVTEAPSSLSGSKCSLHARTVLRLRERDPSSKSGALFFYYVSAGRIRGPTKYPPSSCPLLPWPGGPTGRGPWGKVRFPLSQSEPQSARRSRPPALEVCGCRRRRENRC